jgi:hypothetical protein
MLSGSGAQRYYQALALQKLGQTEKARTLFADLVESSKASVQQPVAGGWRGSSPRARLAHAHYLTGLGYLGLDDRAQAKAELSQAVEISLSLAAAQVELAGMR